MATEPTIEQRLARLEQAVAELQRQLASAASAPGAAPGVLMPAGAPAAPAGIRAQAGASPSAEIAPPATLSAPAVAPRPTPPPRDWAATAQLWIGRAGVMLLMLGLAFLFRYAVVRGWLTPVMRVSFGVVVGAVLLGLGWRLSRAGGRRSYALLLMGGGLSVLYLSAYAAFAFYQLVSPFTAIAALALLALLAVWLASDRDDVLLALVGALGAFAAPLLVRTPHPSIPLFSAYVILVSAWTGWTAVREGWRSLAWTMAISAAAVLILAAGGAHPMAEEVWLTAAAGVSLLGLSAALLWREHGARADAASWKRRPAPWWLARRTRTYPMAGLPMPAQGQGAAAAGPAPYPPEELDLVSAGWLTALATLFFAAYASGALRLSPLAAGAIGFVEAALLAAAAWSWRKDDGLARAILLAAVVPLIAGTFLLQLRGYRGLLALEGLGLLVLARRIADRRLRNVAHAMFAFVALAYVTLLSSAVARADATVTLWHAAMVAAAFAALPFVAPPPRARLVYGGGALLMLLGWLYLTLRPLAGGAYWVDVSWLAVGGALLVAAWLRGHDDLRWGGLLVLAILALRLLLVDIKALPPGGRIIVFVAVGAAFLVLAALYRGKLARKPQPGPGDGAGPPGG